VDVVNVVTPPEVTVDVLAECAAAGCTRIWLQPGSFDDVVLQEAATLRTPSGDRLEVESDACIMVVAARVGR
jgi:predicted CoA-binding protein